MSLEKITDPVSNGCIKFAYGLPDVKATELEYFYIKHNFGKELIAYSKSRNEWYESQNEYSPFKKSDRMFVPYYQSLYNKLA